MTTTPTPAPAACRPLPGPLTLRAAGREATTPQQKQEVTTDLQTVAGTQEKTKAKQLSPKLAGYLDRCRS